MLALTLAISIPAYVGADWSGNRYSGNDRPPVYQRRAFEWKHSGGQWQRNDRHWPAPPVSAGWFQRPYPYHLDYYRMRYGGSYAPYFGNLYGPPQVVTAPPYYGPYYGGYGYPNGLGYDGAYPAHGVPAAYLPDGNGGWYNHSGTESKPGVPPAEHDGERTTMPSL